MENSESKEKSTFDDSEREQHKKQKRMSNSLGALLSGLGSGGPKPSQEGTSNHGLNSGKTSNVQNSTGQQPRGTINPNQMSGEDFSANSEFGWSAASSSMEFTPYDVGGNCDTNNGKPNNSEGTERKDPYEQDRWPNTKPRKEKARKNPSVDRLQDIMPSEFSSWAETRILDDDHDAEWFIYENKKLAELYGEGIITVKYTDQGGLSYYCELCYASMNAKKPLEMHCSGMKHLKKKDTYEKSKASGENPLVERRKILESTEKAAALKRSSRNERSDGGHQERERSRRRSRGRSRSPVGRSRSPLGPSRSPPGPSRSRLRHSRSPPGYGRDSFRREQPYAHASDKERDPYGQGTERFGRADRNDPYSDVYRDDYRRHPGDHSDVRYRADELPRYGGDNRDGLRHPDDRLPHDDHRRYDDDYAYRSRDYPLQSRLPDDPLARDTADPFLPRSRYDSLDRPHSSGSWPYSGPADDRQNRLPSPPPAQPPPPVISAKPSPPIISASSMDSYQNLSSGPAASLLTKLAQCTVKNESDANLASNVINLLLKSLKEYNSKIGEKSVAELMEQAEIKLGTAKAIRKVSKTTASLSVAADPVSIAMETLRRAAAGIKIPEVSNTGPPVFKYF